MLNKNTLGAKNCEANEKQQLNGYTMHATKMYDIWLRPRTTEYTWVTYYIENAVAIVFTFLRMRIKSFIT